MNANQFLKAVEQLQGWRQYLFLVALAERGFPNFVLFSDAIGQKAGARMRVLLDSAWNLVNEKASEADLTRMLARLEQMSPSPEKYDSYGVHPAFDFCQLLEQALLDMLNPGRDRALDASRLATATVMSFIEFSEGEDLDEDELVRLLDHHPLMKADKAFQRELVLSLKRQRTPMESFVADLQAQAADDGVSNLGIALDEGGEDEA